MSLQNAAIKRQRYEINMCCCCCCYYYTRLTDNMAEPLQRYQNVIPFWILLQLEITEVYGVSDNRKSETRPNHFPSFSQVIITSILTNSLLYFQGCPLYRPTKSVICYKRQLGNVSSTNLLKLL